jgi:hypothetical protein
VTSQEPQTPFSANVDEMHETEVIVVSTPAPVFVDSTGRRRRVLRRLAYGFGALCMLYGGLVSVSLAGGPVSSSVVLPLPDLHGGPDDQVAEQRPAPSAGPIVTPSRRPVFVTEALPRRPVSATGSLRPDGPRLPAAAGRRTPSPAPTRKTPAPPGKSPTRPVESTTTSPTSPSPTPTPTPTTDKPDPPVNVPPAPPAPGGGTGGGSPAGGNTGGTGGGNTGGGSTGGTGGGSTGGGNTGGTGGGSTGGDGRDEEPVAPPVAVPVSDPADEPAQDTRTAAAGDRAGGGTGDRTGGGTGEVAA